VETTANLPFRKCPFGHYWYSERKHVMKYMPTYLSGWAVPTFQLDADAVATQFVLTAVLKF